MRRKPSHWRRTPVGFLVWAHYHGLRFQQTLHVPRLELVELVGLDLDLMQGYFSMGSVHHLKMQDYVNEHSFLMWMMRDTSLYAGLRKFEHACLTSLPTDLDRF